jgi:hypothetical protein
MRLHPHCSSPQDSSHLNERVERRSPIESQSHLEPHSLPQMLPTKSCIDQEAGQIEIGRHSELLLGLSTEGGSERKLRHWGGAIPGTAIPSGMVWTYLFRILKEQP